MKIYAYKVLPREVPRGVAQGHIIIPTGRNDHLFLHTKKLARKNNEIAFYLQYFLGVLNSNIFNTFWVLDIDAPTTDLLLRKCTKHTKLVLVSAPYDMYDFEKNVTLPSPA